MSLPLLLTKRVGTKAVLSQANRSFCLTARANAGYWNKDWRPADDPPETEEGRRAAAKKYGLIPEDYETYPNDGTGYGDYPKLPLISTESRDPHALYDIPALKRNFGEPMHVDFDMVFEDKWNYGQKLRVPLWKMVLCFVSCMAGTWTLFQLGEYVRVIPCPKMPEHVPNKGQKHYTFELEDVE